VEHCPPSKIPIAGECIQDPVALMPLDRQAILVSLRMKQRSGEEMEMFKKHWEDPERQQFVYQFQSQLAKYLNTPMDRFRISSISNGSVIVNLVFSPSSNLDPDNVVDRSPSGLLSNMRALQADESSTIYESTFFQTIEREYKPPAVNVYKCEDGEFRTVCPYAKETVMDTMVMFMIAVVGGMIFMIGLCMAIWKCDADIKEGDISGLGVGIDRPDKLDPCMQAEFARSWLENRYMESEKEVRRKEDARAARAAKGGKSKRKKDDFTRALKDS